MNKEKAMHIIEALRKDHVMSEHDLDNLKFLLASPPEVIRDWYEQADEDDYQYAKTILAIAQDYFSDTKVEIDVTQAKQALKKFML